VPRRRALSGDVGGRRQNGAVTRWTVLPSPIDDLLVARTEAGVCGLWMTPHQGVSGPDGSWTRDDGAFDDVREQLAAYWAGELTAFDLPLDLSRGTDFQQRVWAELVGIGYGTTTSYGEVARRLGLVRGASRAVGLANGRNPVSVVVPCHRVIGASGSLTGYGGGLDRKRWLLAHESSRTTADDRLF
jgi:methylated-DNA-[protein]-cysteine S-methyltransferase